jgi:hypothetical protein
LPLTCSFAVLLTRQPPSSKERNIEVVTRIMFFIKEALIANGTVRPVLAAL